MFKLQNMSDQKAQEGGGGGGESLPKTGRVNEMCQEWMVREDGALAYRLQNQEISEHYSGNKYRNALVREDFPRAKSEQLREQQLAEQAAAVYQRMLAEQEEIDNEIAKQLADQLEHEERSKRRALEMQDQDVARQLLERERVKMERHHAIPVQPVEYVPERPQLPPRMVLEGFQNASPHRPTSLDFQTNLPLRRQAKPMALPLLQQQQLQQQAQQQLQQQAQQQLQQQIPQPLQQQTPQQLQQQQQQPRQQQIQQQNIEQNYDVYTEPYKSNPAENLAEQLDRIEIVDNLPLDALTERQIQEEKDAELARQLQEQEGSYENSFINRDRMLAIEAQDKELAKLLQERERNKARRAREKARQKSLAKKQLQQQQLQTNQIMPDDSYNYPADMIPQRVRDEDETYAIPNQNSEDINYSLPADVLSVVGSNKSNYNQQKPSPDGKIINSIDNSSANTYPSFNNSENTQAAIRPTQLDLRSPLNRINKPRYPDPDNCDNSPSSQQHINIAMAIDPTYPRRGVYSSSSYETSSSTVTTSTSSSSPGLMLPSPDIVEVEDDGVVPPYMPIQGQRRTASLEKKQKKKNKDGGCKQQ